MADLNDFMRAIKKAALQAVENEKPVEVLFGKVLSDSPLVIEVEQMKLKLGEKQLVLARNVTDFETEITVKPSWDWVTEEKGGGSGDPAYESHSHDIDGRKRILVHNRLVAGDEVILLRKQLGQKFIVIDRIGKP